MGKEVAHRDELIAEIAARQHGLVTAVQLRSVGLGETGISRRREAGRLHRVHRGVYAVGHPRLTFEGRCLAALLACAPRQTSLIAAVSHRSAATMWGMLPTATAPIDVSLTTRSGRSRRNGIVIHRPPSLSSADVTHRFGIAVTRPARTLMDLRRVVPSSTFQRAMRRAVDLELISDAELPGEPELTRSELERLFLRLCRRFRLEQPEVNAQVGRLEVDFLWPAQRLVVETDGFRHHGNRLSFERDRARDAELQALGYRVLRFTYRQLTTSPGAVAARVRAVLNR